MRLLYGTYERAYVELEPELLPNTMWIMAVYTDPPWRGQGQARRLLTAVCKDADREGMKLMLAVVPAEKDVRFSGLVRLYESVGFHVQYGSTMVRYPTTKEETCSSKTATSQAS